VVVGPVELVKHCSGIIFGNRGGLQDDVMEVYRNGQHLGKKKVCLVVEGKLLHEGSPEKRRMAVKERVASGSSQCGMRFVKREGRFVVWEERSTGGKKPIRRKRKLTLRSTISGERMPVLEGGGLCQEGKEIRRFGESRGKAVGAGSVLDLLLQNNLG